MICGSGYYHGLIEYALREASSPKALVAKVTGDVLRPRGAETTFLLYQCVHGLGHGVMIFSGDNLPWALVDVHKLADSWSEQSCSGGVFMQNFNLPGKLSPFQSTYVKKNDLLYPCNWVRAKYKFYCYLQITEHILYATGYNWKKTADDVRQRAEPWSGICFQSYGRDASGASHYDAGVAYGYCKLTGVRSRRVRLRRRARLREQRRRAATRAAGFCALRSPATLRGFCFYGDRHDPGDVRPRRPWMQKTCRALSARVRKRVRGHAVDRGAATRHRGPAHLNPLGHRSARGRGSRQNAGPQPPANTTLPQISGQPFSGQTLTTTTGIWTNSPSGFAYQWRRCDTSGANCNDIPLATSQSYTVAAADLGTTIRVRVTASNSVGAANADSA